MIETKLKESETTVKTDEKLSGIKLYSESVSETAKILGLGSKLKPGDYFQQGDCILAQLGDSNFKDAPTKISGELQKSNVVLHGITNSHALYDGNFDIYSDGTTLFVDVKDFAILDHVRNTESRAHAEHHAQYIPKGQYFFRGILEFDHLEQMSRQVID